MRQSNNGIERTHVLCTRPAARVRRSCRIRWTHGVTGTGLNRLFAAPRTRNHDYWGVSSVIHLRTREPASCILHSVIQIVSVIVLVATMLAAPSLAYCSDWLSRVNDLRAVGSLPPVVENPAWSQGCWLHSRYMAENNYIGHSEVVSNPWYSSEGAAAAASSNCFLGVGGIDAIDGWMRTPFHGIAIIDPCLGTVGFGSYSSSRLAAALDVIRGLGTQPIQVSYPVYWPASGQTIPFLSYWGGERPDPLANSSFVPPVGPPIFLQIGAGSEVPIVSRSSFRLGTRELDHLVLTETNYTNPDSEAQSLGRAVLDSRDAVVLMPRTPLLLGQRYDVEVVCNGVTYSWWFVTPPDRTPPVTAGTVSPRYEGEARITFSASDNEGGTGVVATYYRLDGGLQTLYSGAIVVSALGRHEIQFWSVDAAGNVEAPQMAVFEVVVPRVTVGAPIAASTMYVNKPKTVYGYLKPRHSAGTYPVRIYKYRYVSGTWKSYGYIKAKAHNYSTYTKYSTSLKLPYRGRWRLRAYYPAHVGHSATWSAKYRYVAVK